jgi:tRNA/rRNA methyltransferase
MEINVVLVRTQFSSNIGQAARSVANMGGQRLILVDPRCSSTNEMAKQGAAGAKQWLLNAVTYADWSAFYANEGAGHRIALTCRGGKLRKPQPLPEVVADLHATMDKPEGPLYLIFGPEADGLSGEDLAFVNRTAALPVQGEFKSLNLAQAVLLGLFLAREEFPLLREGATFHKNANATNDPSTQDPLPFPDQVLRRWLCAIGFSIEKRRMSAYLTMRRLLLQKWPSKSDLHILECILEQNIRKLER